MGNANTPKSFWQCQPDPSEDRWQASIRKAVSILERSIPPDSVEMVLALILGEAQFGTDHWRLGPAKRPCCVLKPVLPRSATRVLPQYQGRQKRGSFQLAWTIEVKYTRFQSKVMRKLLIATSRRALPCTLLWPHGHRFVLTQDIETAAGREYEVDEMRGIEWELS